MDKRGRYTIAKFVAMMLAASLSSAAFADERKRNEAVHSDAASLCPFSDSEISGGNRIEARDGTEMVGLYSCWLADEDNDTVQDLTDLYAHWSVRQLRSAKQLPRSYRRESKSPILRLFVGHDLSVISSLRIDLRDPETTFVIPLANFAYQGRAGKGQSWSTDLVSDDQTQAFFRISALTSARIVLTAKASRAIEVQAAGTVLNALRDISSLVSPGAALITSLNRESIQQTSRALDSALSSIWSESIGETTGTARQLSERYPGARFIIQLTVPAFVKGRLSPGEKPDPEARFTRWYELTLSCPRRSIFSSEVACERRSADSSARALTALRSRVTAQQVINFRIAAGKTVQQYLSDQDWYARFLRKGDKAPGNETQSASSTTGAKGNNSTTNPARLQEALRTDESGGQEAPVAPATQAATSYGAETTSARSESDYAALCNSIVNVLYAAGLSRLDAQIGLWGVVTGSPDFVGIEAYFQKNPRCPQLLPLAGTDGAWKFADL